MILETRVGADGIHSVIRKSLIGEITPRPTGLSAYRLVLPTEKLQRASTSFNIAVRESYDDRASDPEQKLRL